ncbi:unnamed protein product [Adineta ricciae]|uniref:DOMON domain-containing protein n=1 Tax=Adineta ricciae TaxID=249248 RepID=A0A816BG96_ADIRI|nr:unnamed protein product [Adineta ricciae]
MKYILLSLLVVLSLNVGKIAAFDARSTFNNFVRDPPPASNVTVNVTWVFIHKVNVTLVGITISNLQSSQYAALGLGQNQSMGEAHVFMCKRFANNSIAIQRFVNPEGHHPPVPAGSEQGGVFTPLPSKFIDGIVICQFSLSNFAPETVKQLDTLRPLSPTAKYHPLFSVGRLNSTGDAQYHNGREPQPSLVQLNENQNLMFRENTTKPFAAHSMTKNKKNTGIFLHE